LDTPDLPDRDALRRQASAVSVTGTCSLRVRNDLSALYKLEHVNGSWLADQLARLEVRYPEVHVIFADSRFAEEWTCRFLSTALADASGPSPNRLDAFTSIGTGRPSRTTTNRDFDPYTPPAR
jgi:hypothetical protein